MASLDLDTLNQLQNEYDEANSKLSSLNSELSDLNKKKSEAELKRDDLAFKMKTSDPSAYFEFKKIETLILPYIKVEIERVSSSVYSQKQYVLFKKNQLDSLKKAIKNKDRMSRKPITVSKYSVSKPNTILGESEIKKDILKDIPNRENNNQEKPLGIDTISNNNLTNKKNIKDYFSVKNVAIVVVILGLTFGILKYKKII